MEIVKFWLDLFANMHGSETLKNFTLQIKWGTLFIFFFFCFSKTKECSFNAGKTPRVLCIRVYECLCV